MCLCFFVGDRLQGAASATPQALLREPPTVRADFSAVNFITLYGKAGSVGLSAF